MLDENNHHRVVFVTMTEIRSIDGRVLYCLQRDSLKGYDFSGKDLQLADLRGMDLEGCRFCGSDLTSAKLDRAILRGCDFTDSYMIGCTFDGADLTGSSGLSRIKERQFLGGDPKRVSQFYSASWKGCNFTDVDLEWIDVSLLEGGWSSFFYECRGVSVSKRMSARIFL